MTKKCLLINNLRISDSSDEDDDINKVELSEESGDSDNWEETSDQEPMNVDMGNGKSDDEASICSSDWTIIVKSVNFIFLMKPI